jgi:hypothetical protein
MEPISLSASAIVTLLLTKALEKTGETIGEKALNQVGRLKSLIQRKSPSTATTIEAVAKQPDLAKANPSEYGVETLAKRLKSLADDDLEISEAMKSVADTIHAQPQSVQQSLVNIAEKIGIVAPGSVFTGDINL